MSEDEAAPEPDDDWPAMVIVDEKDLVWDEELGYHRCPLGLIQTPRPIVGCRECTSDGTGLKLYIEQLEGEGICDVAVVYEDEQEVCLQAVTCAYDHQRAKYPRLIVMRYTRYGLPPLDGRSLIDAETNEEVWVHRWGDTERASELGAAALGAARPAAAESDDDPDLDIPF